MGNPVNRATGMALLSTMILLLAVTTALATIFYRHQLATGMAARALHGDQAILLALSAESWVSDLLNNSQDSHDSDHLEEDWAQPLPPLPLEGGELRGCLRDLQAKINLNNFAALAEPHSSPLAQAWMALLVDSGAQLQQPLQPRQLLATTVDWLDSDEQPQADGGQEYYPYANGQAQRFPANRPIADVAELAAVAGFNLSLAVAVERYTTALPAATAVNVNTASLELLTALGQASSSAGFDGEQFASWVESARPFATLGDFQRGVAQQSGADDAAVATRWPASLVSVNSDFFELIAQISLGQANLEYRALLDRRDRSSPVVIARTLHWVPAVAPPRDAEQRLRQLRELAPMCHSGQQQLLSGE